ncbi:MAG: serine/threonine protein kinase [Akkermansia sp.]|nr:serine/threonine protein kinase [Akkermansia sp.]
MSLSPDNLLAPPPPPVQPRRPDSEAQETPSPVSTDKREPLPPGTQVGDYTIISKLGQGGFGITYRARHSSQGSIVVIKEHMPTDLAVRVPGTTYVTSTSPETDARFKATMAEFMEEVIVLMGLEHPGIVPIISGFEANGTAYYVMPYVEGQPLEITKTPSLDKSRQAVEARRIKQLLRNLLYTLEYLEQQGIVHRDIKPENIIINSEGRPILLDFGSARQLQEGKVYTNIYTPDFCAPEQSTARSDAQMSAAIGSQTDIYALGATFYYLITRLLPPRADVRTMASPDPYKPLAGRAHLEEHYSRHFLQAIDRALELQPAERWKNASAWRDSMESGIIPPPTGMVKRMRILMAFSIIIVLLLSSLSIWALREKEYATQIYNNSLSFTEGMLYDFNDELADIPGSTALQKQLGNNLKNYLNSMEKLPMAEDEKLQRALATAWKNLGLVNAQQGELPAATEAYRNATKLLQTLHELNPENQHYRYELAKVWLLRADVGRRRNMNSQARVLVGQALNMLRLLSDQSPDNPDYRCDLGVAMDYAARLAGNTGNIDQRRKAIDSMIDLYRELVAQYERHEGARVGLARALISQARLRIESDDYAHATQLLNEARDIYSELSATHPHRLSFKAGRSTESYTRGNMFTTMSNGTEDEALRRNMEEQAMTAFKESISLAEELETLDPNNTEYPFLECRAMAFMVEIMQRRGLTNQSEAYSNSIMQKVNKLLQTSPGNAEYAMIKAGAWRGLARAHAANNKNLPRAAEEMAEYRHLVQEMLEKTPGNHTLKMMYADALVESANMAVETGETRDAIIWLEQAIVLMSDILRNDKENANMQHRMEQAQQKLEQIKAK